MTNLVEQVRGTDPFALTAIEARKLTRALHCAGLTPEARIAFGGNVVFETLAEYLEAHLACSGIVAASCFAPFDQHVQEILNPASALHRFDPNFLFLHSELDPLLPTLADPREGAARNLHEVKATVLDGTEALVNHALEKTRAIVLLTNFVAPDRYDLGLADWRCEPGQQELAWQVDSALNTMFRSEPRVQIVDLCRLMALHGHERARDRRLYYLAKIPWHETFLPVLANELTRHVCVSLGRVRKCLVVDLDNTLWDGVLGEDGPWGVRIGSGDALAEAHLDLQRRIVAIKRRGVLIAACSKNNRADVEEVFRLRPEMPLRLDDFVCLEADWGMKHESLQRIAARLNIGTDSLVFLDDNPSEITLVRRMMPEVECVQVPADPALRPSCLDRLYSLERTLVTAEDLVKTRQYQQIVVRESARREFASVLDYLHSLETRIEIRVATRELLARAHQLFSKTNQFNLTARRYALAELDRWMIDASSLLIVVRASDRFGDLGWIGALLLQRLDTPAARIDNFVLSCRAMGRGIESAILNQAKRHCFERSTCQTLEAEYLANAKNAPVRDLYEKHGFIAKATHVPEGKLYGLAREDLTFTPCDWIKIEEPSYSNACLNAGA